MNFREWPVSRVLWLSVAWVVATLGLFFAWMFHLASVQTQQGDGIGAISVGIGEVLALVVGPPLLLTLLWFVLRRPGRAG